MFTNKITMGVPGNPLAKYFKPANWFKLTLLVKIAYTPPPRAPVVRSMALWNRQGDGKGPYRPPKKKYCDLEIIAWRTLPPIS